MSISLLNFHWVGDKNARNSPIFDSNICSPSTCVHEILISFAFMHVWLRKNSSSWNPYSTSLKYNEKGNTWSHSYGIFSWILSSSMDPWDVYPSLSSTCGLHERFEKISIAMHLPPFKKFFIILLAMSSIFSTHHKHEGLIRVSPLDAWKSYSWFFPIKLQITPLTILAPPWKRH